MLRLVLSVSFCAYCGGICTVQYVMLRLKLNNSGLFSTLFYRSSLPFINIEPYCDILLIRVGLLFIKLSFWTCSVLINMLSYAYLTYFVNDEVRHNEISAYVMKSR